MPRRKKTDPTLTSLNAASILLGIDVHTACDVVRLWAIPTKPINAGMGKGLDSAGLTALADRLNLHVPVEPMVAGSNPRSSTTTPTCRSTEASKAEPSVNSLRLQAAIREAEAAENRREDRPLFRPLEDRNLVSRRRHVIGPYATLVDSDETEEPHIPGPRMQVSLKANEARMSGEVAGNP
jgi:hypothetical protein